MGTSEPEAESRLGFVPELGLGSEARLGQAGTLRTGRIQGTQQAVWIQLTSPWEDNMTLRHSKITHALNSAEDRL